MYFTILMWGFNKLLALKTAAYTGNSKMSNVTKAELFKEQHVCAKACKHKVCFLIYKMIITSPLFMIYFQLGFVGISSNVFLFIICLLKFQFTEDFKSWRVLSNLNLWTILVKDVQLILKKSNQILRESITIYAVLFVGHLYWFTE